jgi:hypothetical protein
MLHFPEIRMSSLVFYAYLKYNKQEFCNVLIKSKKQKKKKNKKNKKMNNILLFLGVKYYNDLNILKNLCIDFQNQTKNKQNI